MVLLPDITVQKAQDTSVPATRQVCMELPTFAACSGPGLWPGLGVRPARSGRDTHGRYEAPLRLERPGLVNPNWPHRSPGEQWGHFRVLRPPASSAHPAASTKSFPSLHRLHQCRSAATSLDLRPVLPGPPQRRGPAARGGTPFVVCATAAESGRSGAGAPPVLRRWRHHLPGKSAGGRDHDQRPVRGADREGSRVIRPRECPGRRRSVRRHPGWAGASGSRPAGRHRRV